MGVAYHRIPFDRQMSTAIAVSLFFIIFHSTRHKVTSRPFSPGVLIDQVPKSLAVIWFNEVGQFVDNHVVLNKPWHFRNAMGNPNGSPVRIATSMASILVGNPTNGLPLQEVLKVFAIQEIRSLLKRLIVQFGELLAAIESRCKILDDGLKFPI
jgi:hypothetical protein